MVTRTVVEFAVVGSGSTEAETPGLIAAIATQPAKFVRSIATVKLADEPAATVTDDGDIDRASDGGGELVTVNRTDTEWLSLPLTPVIVMVYVPASVRAPVATVSVDVRDGCDVDSVSAAGANVARAPSGTPVAVSDTRPAKDPPAVVVTAYVADWPGRTDRATGLTPNAKSGRAGAADPVLLTASPTPSTHNSAETAILAPLRVLIATSFSPRSGRRRPKPPPAWDQWVA